MSKIFIISVFLILLATVCIAAEYNNREVEEEEEGGRISAAAHKTLPPKINCRGACSGRCRLSSRPHLCKRACGTCCARCNCVPPGTSGNEDVCPCYAKLTTHGGRHKCP